MADVGVSLNGAAAFSEARKRMRGAPREMSRELYKVMSRESKPLIQAAKTSAGVSLPSGGGKPSKSGGKRESVADRVVGAKYTVKVTGGRNPITRIQAMERLGRSVDLASLDRGRLRHPLFGSTAKGNWFDQRVPKDWFTRPMEKHGKEFDSQLAKAAQKVIEDAFGK
jgi:hypothetical protein